ncbi:hypothetical protein [Mycolicibacterium doricum]|nr:hypothetical protein [Mycolicibacterium doricum]MCV7268089.1 hypothetical protein [Mycolicibacterium doricum]
MPAFPSLIVDEVTFTDTVVDGAALTASSVRCCRNSSARKVPRWRP